MRYYAFDFRDYLDSIVHFDFLLAVRVDYSSSVR
jgi:hypothetical protein